MPHPDNLDNVPPGTYRPSTGDPLKAIPETLPVATDDDEQLDPRQLAKRIPRTH